MNCPRCGKKTLEDVDFCIWCQLPLRLEAVRGRLPGGNVRRRSGWRRALPVLLLCGILLGAFAIIVSDMQSTAPFTSQKLLPGRTMLDGAYPDSGGYTLRRVTGSIDLSAFDNQSLYAALDATRPVRYADEPEADYLQRYLDDPDQRAYLDGILAQVRARTDDSDDQARICISLVQHIPYDDEAGARTRYPYQVLADNKGDCDEKSLLLAYLLRELGYGVAVFAYDAENHMAVGIAAPPDYDSRDSGYAFVETTRPSIVTDDQGAYSYGGTLAGTPTILPIAEGRTFGSIGEEFADANELIRLRGMVLQPFDSYNYARWQILEDKYALDAENY